MCSAEKVHKELQKHHMKLSNPKAQVSLLPHVWAKQAHKRKHRIKKNGKRDAKFNAIAATYIFPSSFTFFCVFVPLFISNSLLHWRDTDFRNACSRYVKSICKRVCFHVKFFLFFFSLSPASFRLSRWRADLPWCTEEALWNSRLHYWSPGSAGGRRVRNGPGTESIHCGARDWP